MKGLLLIFLLSFSTVSNAVNLWDSRQLLLDNQFEILTSNFSETDQALLTNEDKAIHLYYFTYDSLWKRRDFAGNEILETLNTWHSASPDSFAPLVALGKYHLDYGYYLRGNDFIGSTSVDQIKKMKVQHQKAKKFFLEALDKNPLSLFSYIGLVTLDKTTPILEVADKKGLTEKVITSVCTSTMKLIADFADICEPDIIKLSKTNIFKNAPKEVLSVPLIWKRFIHNYTPRWGGSYDSMESIKIQASEFLKENQILQLSEVMITDEMDALVRIEKFDEAEKLGIEFLDDAGKTNSYKHEEFSGRVYAVLAKTYMKSQQYEKCIKYSELATQLYLWNYNNWSNYGYCALNLNSYELANFAFRYNADTEPKLDAWSAYYLGLSYLRIRNDKLAFLLLSKSVELDNSYSQYADTFLDWLKENEPQSTVKRELIHSEIVGEIYYDGILIQ